jgi:hypothetical protein
MMKKINEANKDLGLYDCFYNLNLINIKAVIETHKDDKAIFIGSIKKLNGYRKKQRGILFYSNGKVEMGYWKRNLLTGCSRVIHGDSIKEGEYHKGRLIFLEYQNKNSSIAATSDEEFE